MSRARVGILHIVHSLQVGGAEKLVHDLALATDPARFRVAVACLDGSGPLAPGLVAAGIPVELLGRRPGLDAALALRIARLARRIGAKTIHAHQYTPYFYAALAARLCGARLVFTEHGRHHPDVRKPKRVAVNRLLAPLTDAIVAVSGFTRDALVRNDGFPAGRIEVVYNGVPIDEAVAPPDRASLRAALGVAADAPVLGLCARLSPEKNVGLLLSAMASVRERFPQVRLLIAGDGPERGRLEADVRARGLSEVVSLLGFRTDVGAVLGALDVFVLPSLTEGTSVTLLEAMRLGVPAVATRVGGNPEIVEDGVTGLLVESGDAPGLAAALCALLAAPERARDLGAAGARRVRERFTFGAMVRRYEELYVG